MKNIKVLAVCFILLIALPLRASVLVALPGPDSLGAGMLMPEISIVGNALSVTSDTNDPLPQLAELNFWSPGDTLQSTASWYSLLDPVGGSGALFNCQYGFTSGGGTLSSNESVGIRLLSRSSNLIQEWNYSRGANRFDLILQNVGSQVLWNGGMWHTYFTLPSTAAPGVYTETFQFFVAEGPFTPGTGDGDYSSNALNAVQDPNYIPVDLTLSWQVAVFSQSTLATGSPVEMI